MEAKFYKQLRSITTYILNVAKSIFFEKVFRDFNKKNINVMDLCAGRGAFSLRFIESLTNRQINIEYILFVEKDFNNANALKHQLYTKLKHKYKVLACDATKISYKKQFDIIFIHPPYRFRLSQDMLNNIDKKKLLSEDGIIILIKDTKEDMQIPQSMYLIHNHTYKFHCINFIQYKKNKEEDIIDK